MKKSDLQLIRNDINAALESVGKKHGLTLHAGNCSYGENNCSFKLECQVEGAATKEESAFTEMASFYGLKADDLGRVFSMGGDLYKICGLSARSRKYPILCEKSANGKIYKFRDADVARHLKTAA